jgi:hypothetical protein
LDRQANVSKGALDKILPIDGTIGVLVELLPGLGQPGAC